MAVGYRLIESVLKVKDWPILAIPGVCILLYFGITSTSDLQNYIEVLGIVLLLELTYLQVRFSYSRAVTQVLAVPLLRVGAVPRNSYKLDMGQAIPGNTQNPDGTEVERPEVVFEAGKPLTQPQIDCVRDLASHGLLSDGDTLEVEQSLPFVPFIVAAAAITVASSGSLVLPLARCVVWLTR